MYTVQYFIPSGLSEYQHITNAQPQEICSKIILYLSNEQSLFCLRIRMMKMRKPSGVGQILYNYFDVSGGWLELFAFIDRQPLLSWARILIESVDAEAKFLDVIGTKVFFLAIYSHLY